MGPPRSTPPARDQNYYFEDGNTVILVENTLLKVSSNERFASETDIMSSRQVHRLEPTRQSMLDRVFSNSASLENQAGESDDNPIRLQGNSVDEVRALMEYLYVLCVSPLSVDDLYLYYVGCRPHDLQKDVNNDDTDIHTRCCLARIAHRHELDSIK